MFIAKSSAIALRYSIYAFVLALLAHRPALAQCGGGGGMSCGGHSMSGLGMGHASHSSGLSNGHSPTGHAPGTPYLSTIRNHTWGGAAASNWMLPNGHRTHGGQGGPESSPGWLSTPFGFRQTGSRPFNGLANPTIRGRASTAFRSSLPGHSMSHWNGTGTSGGRISPGVEDRAPVALPRLQRAMSSSSLIPRLPSADSAGIPIDNHSAHQPHLDLMSESSPGWATKLRGQAQSNLSLLDSFGLRSRVRPDQTTLPTPGLRSLDSLHARISRPNPSARFEDGAHPKNDWTLGGVLGTPPVFKSSLDRISAVELPATRGLEDLKAHSPRIPTSQPVNETLKQTAR